MASTLYTDRGLGVPKRMGGLALQATDTTWKAGEGAVVTGPLEALILAMTGRPVALPELTGPGAAVLAARIGRGSPSLPGSGAVSFEPLTLTAALGATAASDYVTSGLAATALTEIGWIRPDGRTVSERHRGLEYSRPPITARSSPIGSSP